MKHLTLSVEQWHNASFNKFKTHFMKRKPDSQGTARVTKTLAMSWTYMENLLQLFH